MDVLTYLNNRGITFTLVRVEKEKLYAHPSH